MSQAKSLTYRYEALESQQNHNVFVEEYFSGPDTRIFFDGEEMFEISSLSFTVQEQLKPIYGYASRTFDDVAVGSRIILGQFTVPLGNKTGNNFVADDYEKGPSAPIGYVERPSWVEDIETFTANTRERAISRTPVVANCVTYHYAPTDLPIYLAPVEGFPSFDKALKDDPLEVVEELGEWVQVKTAQTSGFVKKASLF